MSAIEPASNVFVQTHDPAVLEYIYPEWPALDSREKYRLLHGKTLSNPIPHAPAALGGESGATHNVVTAGMWHAITESMSFESDGADPFDALAIGDSAPDDGFSTDDETLNNRLGESPITDVVTNPDSGQIRAAFFIGSSEYQGQILRELAVMSESGYMCNHAPIEPLINKSNAPKAATIAVVFTFADESEVSASS